MSDAERRQERGLHHLVRFVGLSQASQPLLTFGASIIIARSLGPEGRGAYGLVITTVAVLPMVIGIGLSYSVRYWAARGQVDRSSLLKTTTAVGCLLGCVAAGVAFGSWVAGRPTWLVPADLGFWGAVAMAAILLLAMLRGLWANYLAGLERYGYGTWGNNAAFTLQLLVLAALWQLERITLDTAVYALAVQLGFSLILFLGLSGRELLPALRAPLLRLGVMREMLRYGAALYLSSLLMQINVRMNVFMLAALGGLHETGLYTAVLGPANFLGLVGAPFNMVIAARTARRHDDPTFAHRVAGALRVMVVISVLPALAAAAVAPLLLPFVFGERFAEAVLPFWLLLPGVIAFTVVHAISQYVAGANRPEWNIRISATGAAATVALNLALIPAFGAAGAAAAYSLAFGAAATVGAWAFLAVSGLRLRDLVAFRASDWTPLLRIVDLRRGSRDDTET